MVGVCRGYEDVRFYVCLGVILGSGGSFYGVRCIVVYGCFSFYFLRVDCCWCCSVFIVLGFLVGGEFVVSSGCRGFRFGFRVFFVWDYFLFFIRIFVG